MKVGGTDVNGVRRAK